MASFMRNLSSRAICVSCGLRFRGGGYINGSNREAIFMAPSTEIELYRRRIHPNSFRRWPGAEMVVEVWLDDYDDNENAIVKPGGSIVAVNSIICSSAVDIWYVQYMPGTFTHAEYRRFLTTIYPDRGHCLFL